MTAGKFRLDTDGDIVVFYIGKLEEIHLKTFVVSEMLDRCDNWINNSSYLLDDLAMRLQEISIKIRDASNFFHKEPPNHRQTHI